MSRKNLILTWVLFLFFAGCSTLGQGHKAPVTKAPAPRPVLITTDFPDIVLPSEMKIDQDQSLVVKTPTYVGGFLVARGRVTADSLIKFFERQLAARGWHQMGSIRYRHILLAFRRPNGSCFIYIKETTLGSVEIKIWASESLETPPPSTTAY
ncbi:MAG TPA: hypothetical protein ENJ40_05325 [Thermosulfurimonas dismutans]|uniref:Lipoprotein n=1 Tax=Thermosulfurimonas dismutans TaxID=999894 RepID=A0A7C3GKL0_9BACT|nr:hypothetical protein [Thermosulfurimonas dismutans]